MTLVTVQPLSEQRERTIIPCVTDERIARGSYTWHVSARARESLNSPEYGQKQIS
jgi:hypothetical protein